MRRLNIIPIVHSRHDLGSLEPQILATKARVASNSTMEANRNAVDLFWSELREGIAAWKIDFRDVLLYQDGLPFTGHPDQILEHRIVQEMATNGSVNHQLLKWMIDQGGTLVGTESTDLLIKEYHAVKRSLASGFRDIEDVSLLSQRDQFIANRIVDTLQDDQIGIIFLGMLHKLHAFLPEEISIEYPFGKPI